MLLSFIFMKSSELCIYILFMFICMCVCGGFVINLNAFYRLYFWYEIHSKWSKSDQTMRICVSKVRY